MLVMAMCKVGKVFHVGDGNVQSWYGVCILTGSALGMRMYQARPNGAFIKDISVTGRRGNYTVEIIPYLCGNTFELISLEGSQVCQRLTLHGGQTNKT